MCLLNVLGNVSNGLFILLVDFLSWGVLVFFMSWYIALFVCSTDCISPEPRSIPGIFDQV